MNHKTLRAIVFGLFVVLPIIATASKDTQSKDTAVKEAASKKASSKEAASKEAEKPFSARVELKDAKGNAVGTVVFTEEKEGVKLTLEVAKLSPGKHGIHIHETGKCETPEFKSAGGHYNPHGKKHGLQSPEGAHGGDLPNLVVNADGTGKAEMMAKGVSLKKGQQNSLFDADGSAVVIHAKEDDEKSDPSGSSGERVVCGVVSP